MRQALNAWTARGGSTFKHNLLPSCAAFARSGQIPDLAGYQWIEKWQECIAIGQPGIGKTRIGLALGSVA
jgi:hypothetical protein